MGDLNGFLRGVPESQDYTICFIFDDRNRTLLKLANRGVSEGKWNAPGGKFEKEDARDPFRNAIRETQEETGLSLGRIFYHGLIHATYEGVARLDSVHILSTREFSGRLRGSDAGAVRWFPLYSLPMHQMWHDTHRWFDKVVSLQKFPHDYYAHYDKEKAKVLLSGIVLERKLHITGGSELPQILSARAANPTRNRSVARA